MALCICERVEMRLDEMQGVGQSHTAGQGKGELLSPRAVFSLHHS